MQLKVDPTAKWEDLISTVVQDQVPIGCVKKVIFKLKGGKQKTINLNTLRKQGLEIEEIETVITRSMIELSSKIVNMDFVIDINRVAEYVQPLTDKILEKL
jgi:hypothetical protein